MPTEAAETKALLLLIPSKADYGPCYYKLLFIAVPTFCGNKCSPVALSVLMKSLRSFSKFLFCPKGAVLSNLLGEQLLPTEESLSLG